jgi:two-component system OmpR family sensor kinase
VLLRTRIVLTVLCLLALGLILAGAGTFASLFEWKSRSGDRLLTSVGREAGSIIAARGGTDARLGLPPFTDDLARLWRAGVPGGDVPALLQVRGPGGQVVQTIAFGATPPIPAAARPRRITADNPDGEAFIRVDADRAATGRYEEGPFGRRVDWRFRTAWLPGGRGTIIVAMRTTETDELVGRTVGIQTTVTLLVLFGVGLLAWRAIRSGMRGLEDIAATADAIGGGDLSRRVPQAPPKTEVGRLALALNTMLGQIEAAFGERAASEARLRRFVADASHELRTPVATIRGYAELFRRGAADRPADLAKAMRRIESEAERMGSLVDEMLLLARLDQGRPLAREPVDLVALGEDAVADARAVEPDRPLAFEANGGAVIVDGDPAGLRQVLGNLLANVRCHTPPGAPATVRLGVRDGAAVIEVADEGPGLTGEQRERVFERFYRVDRVRARGGSGLGLSIVAAVVAAHDGTATVTGAPGTGATFEVVIPLLRTVPGGGAGLRE